ncbi:DpnD/PcfM family protein [Psychrobacter sanguinis]|uniref:DpnD/PcfM family protein n=2 Tax=Psychrobacter sanguinis TaxID=861445 RepID=UPI00020C7E2C|nr:DpnD/PcfM family protein [Psychrobacter sanguinis]EGK13356.1 DpnD protein [Psychrobacter sp. 1501(2011)]MCC3308931.1 DpnD/PcfM family protein [Psychrobacter sanguinis]MCD9150363.1 DpnD/PcfM family protein [Psychrobacter sanguinis]UEC26222.1 DpnD/PcfM family protein [Psychrobacter sanguinis]
MKGLLEELMSETPKTYCVEVTETLSKLVKISASSEEQALSLVKQAYRQESIVLTSEDYLQTNFLLNGAKDN